MMLAEFNTGFLPLAYAYSSNSASGRISLPVSSSQVLYSSFEHVSGVAAPAGSGALSIESLKILDTLIAHLESVKSQPLEAALAPKELTPGRVDALIQQYGSELHAKAVQPAKPYVPSVPAPAGMLFSFAA